MTPRFTPLVAAAFSLAAGAAGAQTVASSFNQVYTGPRNTAATDDALSSSIATARSQSFTLASLAGGSATLRANIKINAQAANWQNDGAVFQVFGFLQNASADTPRYSDTQYFGSPYLFFQNNAGAGPATGACINSQFLNGSGDFVFGSGPNYKCSVAYDNATQTAPLAGSWANYTMQLNADGSYLGSVQFLDANGLPVLNPSSPGGNFLTISGTVANLAATFTPFLRLRPGYDTGADLPDPNTPWRFDVTNASLNVTPAAISTPEPGALALVAAGLVGVAGAVRRRRQA